jgi:PAS domain S-box-containing protein
MSVGETFHKYSREEDFPSMTVQKRMAGSDEPQMPDDLNKADASSSGKDTSHRFSDLRSLIQNWKEKEKLLNLRLSLLQGIFDGADIAVFSVDTQCCYTSFNKKHASDMQELYGSTITVGENLAESVPVEKDFQKILHLIRQALSGEPKNADDYFGDAALGQRHFDLFCYPLRNDTKTITGAAVIATDTTTRQQSERTLAQQEERFRRLAEDAPDLLFRMSLPEGKYEYVSPASLAFTGYTPEEFLKRPGLLYELVHLSAKDAFGRYLDLLIKGNNPPASVFQIVCRNGEMRWWYLRTTLVRDAAGHPVAAEGVITDVTGWKKEQIALEETKEWFRTIVDSADAGIVLVDAKTHIIADANPRALEMIGAPHENVVGAVCHRFICPTEAGRCPVTDLGERLDESERVVLAADGRSIPVLKTVVPVKISGRDMLIESFIDFSEQKKTGDALRQSEKRYRELIEHSIDIICTLTFTGEITSISPAVSPLLGYQPDELTGKNILDFLKPESRQRLLDETEKIRSGGRSDTFYEVEIRAKDDRFIPFEMNIRVRSEGDGGPDIIGIAREISERKKNEDALKESEERFRTLLQCVPSVAVQGFLPDYTVVYWNEATAKMFGYTAQEAMGKDIRTLLIPPDVQKELTATCDRMALTGVPGPSTEMDLLHRDGRKVPVFVSHAVVKIPGKSTLLFCIGVDLTERKTAEGALKDAERRLQSILDVAPFGTFVYELHEGGSLIFVSGNRSADRILGTDCSRFIGKTIDEAFPALVPTGIPDEYRRVARTGEPFHSDAVPYETDGITGIFEVHAVPLAQNRMTVFFRDISEKRKAEEELEQSETRFRALIQNSSDIIQILDREKRLVYNSPAFSKILGYPEGSQNGRFVSAFTHPDDRERVMADLEEVYSRTNPGTPTEYRMITADGNFLYVESVGVNLLGVPGVDGIVINTHTVHERKQAEQALAESEERFRLIFQHSNDAIYLFEITPSGMPGKIVDANDVALRQSGYTKEELVQKNLLEIYSRDLSQRSRAIMMELLTRGESRFETEKIKKDGSLLPVEISARLAKLKDKSYVIAISRDISQRKREERALRIANQKLQLMNIVAWHDIQNKVNGLRGYVELSKDLVTDEKLKKFIDSEDDVLKVIHRQLQYTKEYQEMGIHPPQWVNLPQVLRMLMSFKDIGPLKFRMDLHDLELYCDPIIEKVFTHLIENTQKHGEKATEIHIICRKTADGIFLIYEDDGIGIPEERKKDLFVRGVGSATGFSLFFVHDILEISDMTIQETGEPGKGVRFEIFVPRGLYRIGRKSP